MGVSPGTLYSLYLRYREYRGNHNRQGMVGPKGTRSLYGVLGLVYSWGPNPYTRRVASIPDPSKTTAVFQISYTHSCSLHHTGSLSVPHTPYSTYREYRGIKGTLGTEREQTWHGDPHSPYTNTLQVLVDAMSTLHTHTISYP